MFTFSNWFSKTSCSMTYISCFFHILSAFHSESIYQLNYEALATFSFRASCLCCVFFRQVPGRVRNMFQWQATAATATAATAATLATATAATPTTTTTCCCCSRRGCSCWLKCWLTLHALIALWNCFFINV